MSGSYARRSQDGSVVGSLLTHDMRAQDPYDANASTQSKTPVQLGGDNFGRREYHVHGWDAPSDHRPHVKVMDPMKAHRRPVPLPQATRSKVTAEFFEGMVHAICGGSAEKLGLYTGLERLF
jgi:hypothetical protein